MVDVERYEEDRKYAIGKAKERYAKKRDKVEPKPRVGKKSKTKYELYPMDSWDGGSHDYIDWSLNDDAVEDVVNNVRTNNLTILQLPTGVGKTVVSVKAWGVVQEKLGYSLPVILVVPRAVLDQHGWQKTIASYNKAHPDNVLRPFLIDTPDRMANILKDKSAKKEFMESIPSRTLIIFDEFHGYKNPTSKRSKTLVQSKLLKEHRGLGVTATPLTNNVIMDTISYLVLGGYYTSKTAFENKSGLANYKNPFTYEYEVYDGEGHVSSRIWGYYDTMVEQFSNILVRPDVEIGDLNMPNVSKLLHQLPPSRELNSKMFHLRNIYDAGMFSSAIDFRQSVIETIYTTKYRLNAMWQILEEKGAKQPLIFYWHNSVLAFLREFLDEKGVKYQVLNGESNMADVDFESDMPILVQYQAGAEGIEMRNSDTTIFFENQFSFSKLIQAEGRNVRREMGGKVTHHYLVDDNIFDRMVYSNLINKFDITEKMLDDTIHSMMTTGEEV